MTVLMKALALAERGFLVFPCGKDKRPTCARGFHAAERDPEKVERLFWRSNAVLVGVPTGAASGFDVLDWDPKNGGAQSIAALRHRLPQTREHRTRSGGGHLFFLHHEGVRNTASKIAQGVDTRGDGGYVIWWPSHGCLTSNAAGPAPWPTWLLEPILHKPKPTPAETAWRQRVAGDDTYARRVVQRQLERVAAAKPGARHDTLRAASKVIGGILHMDDGTTSSQVAAQLLSAVKEAGGSDVVEKNAAATIEWALTWGAAKPLTGGRSNG